MFSAEDQTLLELWCLAYLETVHDVSDILFPTRLLYFVYGIQYILENSQRRREPMRLAVSTVNLSFGSPKDFLEAQIEGIRNRPRQEGNFEWQQVKMQSV
jgi:hypothetical protein